MESLRGLSMPNNLNKLNRPTGSMTAPYISPDAQELARVNTLRQFVPDAMPLVRKADWYCTKCRSDYHAEKYCTHCHTGIYSIESGPKPKDD